MGVSLVTKVKILKPAEELYDAFVNPDKISNFWFSSSSCRWENGKTVTLAHKEYNVEFDIYVAEAIPGEKIIFEWGNEDEKRTNIFIFKALSDSETIVEITETGWNENSPSLIKELIKNKEGWVYMLASLKAYLENDVTTLRNGLII